MGNSCSSANCCRTDKNEVIIDEETSNNNPRQLDLGDSCDEEQVQIRKEIHKLKNHLISTRNNNNQSSLSNSSTNINNQFMTNHSNVKTNYLNDSYDSSNQESIMNNNLTTINNINKAKEESKFEKIFLLNFLVEQNQLFVQNLIEEINKIRSKPKSYSKEIEYYEKYLQMTSDDGLILNLESEEKILINSYESFEELRKLYPTENNVKSILKLSLLKLDENLIIRNLPSDPLILQNFDYMSSQFVIKKLGLS